MTFGAYPSMEKIDVDVSRVRAELLEQNVNNACEGHACVRLLHIRDALERGRPGAPKAMYGRARMALHARRCR